jgi:hypothetical protein
MSSKFTDPRAALESAGLLPNPNQLRAVTGYAGRTRSSSDVLLRHYEDLVRELADEVVTHANAGDNSSELLAGYRASARRRGDALDWLSANYELDELALEVIAHVLQES